MKKLNNIKLLPGWHCLPGIQDAGDSCSFSVEAPEDAEVSLLLYQKNSKTPDAEIPLDESTRSGRVRAIRLGGVPLSGLDYNYKINGEIVQDPYAHMLTGREHFGEPLPEDPHMVRGHITGEKTYDWGEDASPDIPLEDMVVYKLHVRGFTKAAAGRSRKKGTFAGVAEMIPYFQELGVNTLELMPVYEFKEVTPDTKNHGMVTQRQDSARVNFWGYTDGFYFAPKRTYASTDDPQKEFRGLVRTLHEAGIKCVLEFYFPETINPSIAVRALQFWKLNYHVDGFHVSGNGLPSEVLLKDGILSDTLLFLPGVRTELLSGEQEKRRTVAEINSGFMEDMRRFLKSDEGMVESAMWRTRRNEPGYGVINYMACQDGFTLNDSVTYNYKHNEANGENNEDGSSFNYSWNCGVEGPSRKAAIRKIREKQLRNAVLMLMLSQGTPLLYAGDEFGNSQGGNNNAWCQDNETGWVDWKSLRRNQKLFQFVCQAAAFRKSYPILHTAAPLKGTDYLGKGFPDVSYHGERAWYVSCDNTSRMFGALYYGGYAGEGGNASKRTFRPEDFLYIAYNFHWETRSFALPSLPEGIVWKKIIDTSADWDSCFTEQEEEYLKTTEAGSRSIVVLQGKQVPKPKGRQKRSGESHEE